MLKGWVLLVLWTNARGTPAGIEHVQFVNQSACEAAKAFVVENGLKAGCFPTDEPASVRFHYDPATDPAANRERWEMGRLIEMVE
jgi:hypothetical protein